MIHVLTVGFGPNITLVIVDILLPNFDGAFFRRDYLRLTRKPRLLEMSGVFWEADKQPNLCEAASGFTLSTVIYNLAIICCIYSRVVNEFR